MPRELSISDGVKFCLLFGFRDALVLVTSESHDTSCERLVMTKDVNNSREFVSEAILILKCLCSMFHVNCSVSGKDFRFKAAL